MSIRVFNQEDFESPKKNDSLFSEPNPSSLLQSVKDMREEEQSSKNEELVDEENMFFSYFEAALENKQKQVRDEISKRYRFSQSWPEYALQPVSEEDPFYLLKLLTIEPPPKYVPTFLTKAGEFEAGVFAINSFEELPFKEIMDLQEIMGMP